MLPALFLMYNILVMKSLWEDSEQLNVFDLSLK